METIEKVEVPEKIEKTEAAPLPTREDLKARGFTAAELESAEKRGMVATEQKKETASEAKPEEAAPEKPAQEAKPEARPEPAKDHISSLKEVTLTPEQEALLHQTFPATNGKAHPVVAMYIAAKNERSSRQRIASELEKEKKAREAVEAELAKIRSAKADPEPELDADGNPIDPKKKPLTVEELERIRKQEAEEQAKKDDEIRQKGALVASALKDQEETAKLSYENYDETVKLATDLMTNIDTLLPDAKSRNRAIMIFRDLQVAAARADELGADDLNAADLSYELGKLHPNYGKNNGHQADDPKKTGPLDPKANGGLSAEAMERAERNSQRRRSSAAASNGGGKTQVLPDEVTLEQFVRLDSKAREKFRKNHPEAYARLSRG